MSSAEFVDEFAETFNAQVTVFENDISVSSTISMPGGEPGERAVGTQVRADIAYDVLVRGESVMLTLNILDTYPHLAYYFPLYTLGDEIVGMFFIGIPNDRTTAATNTMRNRLLMIGLTGMVVAGVLLYFVLTKSTKFTLMSLKNARYELMEREILLDTVNQTAEILLTASTDDTLSALMEGMEMVGVSVDADRVQIWRNEIIDDELHFVLRYEWQSEIAKQKNGVPAGKKFSYREWPDLMKTLIRSDSVNTPFSQLSAAQTIFPSLYEIVSLVIVPLFLEGQLVGFFSVNDCRNKLVFSNDEMSMFSSTGLMFLSAFIKHEQTIIQMEKTVEERTSLLLENAPMGITLFNRDLQPIDCNAEAMNMYNDTSKQEYFDTYFASMIKPQKNGENTVELMKAAIQKAFDEGYAFIPEFIDSTRDGETIITENTLIRRRYKNDFAVVSYSRNITARKLAEEREQQAEELTRKLLDNAPFYLEIWHDDCNIYDCNEKLLNVLGISDKKELCERFYELSAPIQPCGTPAEKLNLQMLYVALTEGIARTEWNYLLPNGDELPVDMTWVRIMHKDNPLIVVYSHDLRPVKAAAAAEHEINKLLMDYSPVIMNIWDETPALVATSRQSIKTFQVPSMEEYMEKFYLTFP
jgi:PAS domain-containing protein